MSAEVRRGKEKREAVRRFQRRVVVEGILRRGAGSVGGVQLALKAYVLSRIGSGYGRVVVVCVVGVRQGETERE